MAASNSAMVRAVSVERLMDASSRRLEREWVQRFDEPTVEGLRALLVEIEAVTG